MSTAGKSSIRKDKKFVGINNIFEEQDIKKAALEKENQEKEVQKELIQETRPVVQQEEKAEIPEKGRGVGKKTEVSKKKEAPVKFFKETKVVYKTKSCYLSVTNLNFVTEMSNANGITFSEVLNQIIDNFRENI